MRTSDFDYDLPIERIAQTPIEPRHASRLLVLQRDKPQLEHTTFWNVSDYLLPGDLLVIIPSVIKPCMPASPVRLLRPPPGCISPRS